MADPVVIVPAAGQGKRMGGDANKPYLLLGKRPVLAHTLEVFTDLGLFSRIIPVIAPGEEEYFRDLILLPYFSEVKELFFPVTGGRTRQDSVFNALTFLRGKGITGETIICIHDGARPLVSGSLVRSALLAAGELGAALVGVAPKDTVKRIDEAGFVQDTPPREHLLLAQTPQCFRFSIIWGAHLKARGDGFAGSDDAVLVERMGMPVKVVPGDYSNIKLTTPHDLEIARVLYPF
ncbi:MAG TPA: 2-C-methyl-D-erythritol 4-phosphate cytidylyltransferase [Firmicutes bacterium]|jgi:2-C-methyl-D-erythritol 4-phosphate cytidylyltransferase|nr:2-C-methyl-D-erythritol 4-phosphate cytidylyltransferase [Bacillota bacterium]